MYDELVQRLRDISNSDSNIKSNYIGLEMLQAADAIEELSKPKWIPVTERLPKGADASGTICENVNLLLDDGLVTCGWMNGITDKVYYLNVRDDYIQKAPISRVTHWMPLPRKDNAMVH